MKRFNTMTLTISVIANNIPTQYIIEFTHVVGGYSWSRESSFDQLKDIAEQMKPWKSLHQKFPKRSFVSCLSTNDPFEEMKKIKEVLTVKMICKLA
jgi:hypothetical protein